MMRMLLLILGIALIGSLLFGPLSAADVVGIGTPSPSLYLYARDVDVVEGHGCVFVIEMDHEYSRPITIDEPIVEQAFNKVEMNSQLPQSDPVPDEISSSEYTLVITSFMSAGNQRWEARSQHVPGSIIVPSGAPFLLKYDISGVMIGLGPSRLRATLFKGRQPVAMSNVISIRGLPDPTPISPSDAAVVNRLRNVRLLPPERPNTTQPSQ